MQFSPDAHLYFESCSWDWCFKIDIIFIVNLLLDRICPTGLLDCSTKTNNKKLFERNSKLKILNNFKIFMNPEFKRVNVNFVCFCSSVEEQTGLPFVKRTSESSFAEACLKVCNTNEPHLQDEHQLKIMKDMKFKTLPHINPINM